MNERQKFENFLESLKGNGQDTLIESVKKGFQVCFENEAALNEGIKEGFFKILKTANIFKNKEPDFSAEKAYQYLSDNFSDEDIKEAIMKIGDKKMFQNRTEWINNVHRYLNKNMLDKKNYGHRWGEGEKGEEHTQEPETQEPRSDKTGIRSIN